MYLELKMQEFPGTKISTMQLEGKGYMIFSLNLQMTEVQYSNPQDWFFIMSELDNNLVMDVAFCRTTSGTQVISYTRKNPPRPNQLWRKEHVGENTFYLVSQLHSGRRITIKVINLCSHLYLQLTSYLHCFILTGWQCSH